ncbi:outer membrane lipoprotein LolB [mine drainage metagenome]|uniref:Outer membrane lipoprotein LolB n=1 Tax=mine drainage metagenome TaxID=410659 RepID=T0Y6R2_9ZZZZ
MSLPGAPAREALWRAHEAKIVRISGFEMEGQIGVIDHGRGFTGSLAWRERPRASLVLVRGPLGSGGFRLSGRPGDWVLVTARGAHVEIRHGLCPALRRWFGIPVPLESLRFWVLGLPDPRFAAEFSWTARGRVRTLLQDRWQVRLSRYVSIGGRALPTHLVLTHGATRIRVRVGRWSIVRGHPTRF